MEKTEKKRCSWAGTDSLYSSYHDNEWGVPLHDDRRLFEMLVLEGMQAGLSWLTVLKKREAFRKAFAGFDIDAVMNFDEKRVESLLEDKGIIRNRLKIMSAIANAHAFRQVQEKHGSFDAFIWSYVNGRPIINSFASLEEVPARTSLSDQISKDLKKLGFSFVGSTIVYAYMQSIGMVNDHTADCFLYGRER